MGKLKSQVHSSREILTLLLLFEVDSDETPALGTNVRRDYVMAERVGQRHTRVTEEEDNIRFPRERSTSPKETAFNTLQDGGPKSPGRANRRGILTLFEEFVNRM